MVAYAGTSLTLLAARMIDSNSLQLQKPIGSTIIPVFGSSDQTHLTNFSGDKKAWPVFLSLGNVRSSEWLKETPNCSILVALLPVLLNDCFHGLGKSAELKAQQDDNREVLRKVFEIVFTPLTNLFERWKHMLYSDWRVRKCFPIICTWIADYVKNVNLHFIKSGFCHICEAPKSSFGSKISLHAPLRDYPGYFRKLIEATHPLYSQRRQDKALQYLNKRRSRTIEVVCWALRCFDSTSAFVPDVFHTIYPGLLKHLMDWLVPFLAYHKRLAVFNRL